MTEQDILNLLSLSEWDRFFYNYQNVFYYMFCGLTVLRVFINHSIYDKLESALFVHDKTDLQELKDMFKDEHKHDHEKYYYPKKPMKHGSNNAQFTEFILICVFTLYWGDDLGDNPKIKVKKKIANFLNLLWVPALIGSIVLLFHMREINYFMGSAKKDLFYFSKPYNELLNN